MTKRNGLRRLLFQVRQPPADMYVRVEQVGAVVKPLQSMESQILLLKDNIASVKDKIESLKDEILFVKNECSSLKNVLPRVPIGLKQTIPYELAEAVASLGEENALYRAFAGTDRPMSSPPAPVSFTSSLCHQQHFMLDQFRFWLRAMKIRPRFHRKWWELFYIAQTLFERGFLTAGKRGIGFGIGHEPLPALFASFGAEIVASDQSIEAAEGSGWVKTGEHCHDLSALNWSGICTETMFSRLVSFREVDMNNIPSDLDEGFDFCWSSCSLEHLGSLQHGLDFIENSLRALKSGGVAVHTTEFNLSSDVDTVESADVSFYRRCDIDEFLEKMRSCGFIVSPINWTLGEGFAETVVDMPPWGRLEPHIRLKAGEFDVTSIGLIIQKPS